MAVDLATARRANAALTQSDARLRRANAALQAEVAALRRDIAMLRPLTAETDIPPSRPVAGVRRAVDVGEG
jgi:hypothetical protein